MSVTQWNRMLSHRLCFFVIFRGRVYKHQPVEHYSTVNAIDKMCSNMLLIPHPQLKPSHLTMSGSRSCPNFSHLAQCLAWRNPDSVVLTVQPSPALSRLTGQCYVLRPHVVLEDRSESTGQDQMTNQWETRISHMLY